MICPTTSKIISFRYSVFIVPVLIGLGYLWIYTLQGRRWHENDHSSHDRNYGVVKSFIRIKNNFQYSIHLSATSSKKHRNRELIDNDVSISMEKSDHDDEIIYMKRSLLLSDNETLILEEELENNNLVGILQEEDFSSMKILSVSHGGDNDENDGDHIASIIKKKEEQALYIIENGNTSTSIYHYFKRVFLPGGTHDLKILYWKPDGYLDDESLVDTTRDWWHVTNYTSDNRRQPTEYGTIALLKDHDYISGIPWELTPPAPLLFYSMPNEFYNPEPTSNHKLVLVPEDRNGINTGTIAWAYKAASNKTYEEKLNIIIWRGTNHNEDNREILIHNMSSVDSDGNVWLDAKESFDNAANIISVYDMARDYKYQLDIGGVSGTTWVALRWKMCSGNVVFKVDSWSRDWWHNTIVPWEHYIPVQEDLSDLYEQYVWAETHPEEAYEIAQKGQKSCLETHQEDYMASYEANIIQSLPPASEELVSEMNLIREGYITLVGWSCC